MRQPRFRPALFQPSRARSKQNGALADAVDALSVAGKTAFQRSEALRRRDAGDRHAAKSYAVSVSLISRL
jgi:hypothetical protein